MHHVPRDRVASLLAAILRLMTRMVIAQTRMVTTQPTRATLTITASAITALISANVPSGLFENNEYYCTGPLVDNSLVH